MSDAGRLLAGAERSFDSVRQGLGNATGTVFELSACLDAKEKGLLRAEKQLRQSRAEADKLKKVTIDSSNGDATVSHSLLIGRKTEEGVLLSLEGYPDGNRSRGYYIHVPPIRLTILSGEMGFYVE